MLMLNDKIIYAGNALLFGLIYDTDCGSKDKDSHCIQESAYGQ